MQTKPSSHIADIKWARSKLTVTFVSGSIYEYRNVPKQLFVQIGLAILHGESAGEVFNAIIRSRPDLFPYRRIK